MNAQNMQYVKNELFNPNAMKCLLNHNGIAYDTKQQLKKYFKKRQNGNCVQCVYDWCKEYSTYQVGRVYVAHSNGLQGFPREIRNALAKGFYWDLDMVNAHPTILLQVCKNKGWMCTQLDNYVNNRSEVLNQIIDHYGCQMKDAKNLMIRMMFLGFPEAWVGETVCENATSHLPFITEYKCELLTIAQNVWASYPEISNILKRKKKTTDQQRVASCLSLFLQTEEHKILMAVDEALKQQGRQMDTYIFDGGLVKRLSDENELPRDIIIKCEEHVKHTTGYDIKLIVKDLETTFEFEEEDENDYYVVKRAFEQTHFKVMRPCLYVEQLPDGKFHFRDEAELKKTYRNMDCIHVGESKKFINIWIDDANIRTYETIDFRPPPLSCPSTCFNMWQGFAAERLEVESSNNIESALKHIKVLMKHDEKAYDYFIKFLAQIAQEPGKVSGIAIVLKSEQGAGKNIFLDFLSYVFGEDLYYETADPKQTLWSRFAKGRMNKVLINIDETSGKDTYPFADQLKNMITSKTFNFEEKGVSPVTLVNLNRIIFTTNNSCPIKVEEGDRRYVVIKCSDEMKGNTQYFNEFGKYINDPANQKAFFEFLKGVDISQVDWINDRPITNIYKDIQEINLPIFIKFFKHLVETTPTDSMGVVLKYTSKHFLQLFDDFLEQGNFTGFTMNCSSFGLKLHEYLETEEHGFIKRTMSKGYAKYAFTTQDMKEYLYKKGYLRDDEPERYAFVDDDD